MDKEILASREVLDSFKLAFDGLREDGKLNPAITMEELEHGLNAQQRKVVQKILKLDPRDYGVTIPRKELESVPSDLVRVTGQTYWLNGEQHIISEKLVPRSVYHAFEGMNRAFKIARPGRELLIESGYRSPANQVIAFINWSSNKYDGEISETIRHVSPPSYSQHTIASKTALDIANIDGQPTAESPESFRDSVEYKWLRSNASKFGFFESWKEGNSFGMRAEPWHWQYLGSVRDNKPRSE